MRYRPEWKADTKWKLKDLIKPAAMDGHWDKGFKTSLRQGLERLPVKEEEVAELGRPVEDDDEENSVILGGAVRVWDEDRLPRVVLLLVPDLQAAMSNFVLELKFVKTLSSVESQTFFFTKY